MYLGKRSICRRSNYVHAAYVNAALKLKFQMDVDDVFRLLSKEGVNGAVIARVLFMMGPFRELMCVDAFKVGDQAREDWTGHVDHP